MNIKRFALIVLIIVISVSLIYLFWPQRTVSYQDKEITLKRHRLTVYQNSELIWQSESDYKVVDFILADLDFDNNQELIALLYKRGYYGSDLPFWEEENINDYGQHLFVYELNPEVKLKWGSSTLKAEIKNFDWQDEKLIVNQSEQWIWQEFGFEKVN